MSRSAESPSPPPDESSVADLLSRLEVATDEAEILALSDALGLDLDEPAADLDRDRFVVRSLADVAEFFDVALQTAKQWRSERPPMPGEADANGRGRFDLAEIVRWRLAKAERQETRELTEKRELEKRKLEIEIEAKQLKLDQERGRLVLRDDVAAGNRRVFAHIRARVEAIAEEMAASLTADQVVDMKNKIHLALRDLSG